jgi:predicted negative regulator of RcsB-dependent stress response
MAIICLLFAYQDWGQALEEKKEIPTKKEIQASSLTEQEQKDFEKFGGNWYSPAIFKSENEAIKYLKILLKGNEKTIRWYQDWELLGKDRETREKEKKQNYGENIATALHAINTKTNKEGLQLAIEVLKTKREYPEALEGAADAIRKALRYPGDEELIPLLREIVTYPNSSVRLFVAKALLELGDSNTALPILDQVTREGYTAALGYIFDTMKGKEWEQKGIASFRKALTYENKESKALGALFLIRLSNKGRVKVDLEKIESMLLEMFESILNKQKWDEPINGEGYSDGRAVEIIIPALKELKSHKAIPLLKRLLVRPETGATVRKSAEWAIKQIELPGGSKSK